MADRLRDVGLVEETSRLTQPPEYDVLLGRAGRRRRRTRLGTVAASVAVVVAAVGTGALLTDAVRQTTPEPVNPLPSRTADPSPTPTEDAVSEADRLRALSPEDIVAEGEAAYFVANRDGSTLTYWYECGRKSDVCVGALRLVTGSGAGTTIPHEHGGWPPIMKPAGDGFLIKTVNTDRTFLLSPDGSRRSVSVGDPPLPIAAGHVTVVDNERFNVVDPDTGKAWALLQPADVGRIVEPVIDETGRVWAIGSQLASTTGSNEVVWTDDATKGWQRFQFDTERNLPGRVIVRGDLVVATAVGDGATVAPIDKLAVSSDRGATWTVLEGDDVPFEQINGMAATDDGTLLVSDYAGRLWRSHGDDWTRFVSLEEIPEIDTLAPSGGTVVGLTRSPDPEFVRIEDDGSFSRSPAR